MTKFEWKYAQNEKNTTETAMISWLKEPSRNVAIVICESTFEFD